MEFGTHLPSSLGHRIGLNLIVSSGTNEEAIRLTPVLRDAGRRARRGADSGRGRGGCANRGCRRNGGGGAPRGLRRRGPAGHKPEPLHVLVALDRNGVPHTRGGDTYP